MSCRTPAVFLFAGLLGAGACSAPEDVAVRSDEAPDVTDAASADVDIVPTVFDAASRPYELNGPLVPATVSMVSAWDIPNNPLTDSTLEGTEAGARVRWGYRLFMDTPGEAPQLTPGGVSCGNCHLNAGQRELALPLVGSAGMFPEYNRRAGRDFTLADRIVGCFMRSQNAPAGLPGGSSDAGAGVLPEPTSDEVLALVAYLEWLQGGFAAGENPPWRKQNRIPTENLIPLDQLDPEVGAALFTEHCTQCHGEDGQGVQIGDKKAGPMWGPGSWNDGAGAARVYTLAGIIRYMMPYLNPGVLTDEEAQQISAFITSQPRPAYPHKDQDYLTEPRPIDAVYYDR
ncbi:MAG: c-type cytochrome [Vicinamibacterales bacterium]|jgi:thiosulfate dehydrogenase|nr:c-type cytochrome [Vicinamibacterales bacterium]MDP7692622.1 c-type cytochrome [Vicinamibacterales bacterium]HJN44906.1 c-type cytochrome [Vicinamibacterales bacterium]|tara:strand:- start:46 stop:1074 length:1029 start_codon:yes stop_codon:yes gene_type:complete